MRNGDHDNIVVNHAIDDAKGKASQKKIAVSNIAQWKALRIGCNLCQCAIELGVKIVGSVNATLGIPG